jgi:hypothetical protein
MTPGPICDSRNFRQVHILGKRIFLTVTGVYDAHPSLRIFLTVTVTGVYGRVP